MYTFVIRAGFGTKPEPEIEAWAAAFYFLTVRPRPDWGNNLGSTVGLFTVVPKVQILEYSGVKD